MAGAPAMSAATDAAAAQVVGVRVPRRSWRSELRAIKIVWQRELHPLHVSDRLRIVTSLVQPLLFLFVLGTGLSAGSPRAGTARRRPQTFIYPGILCMAVLFTAIFSAASIVWDREFGFLREMMVAPVRRSSIVIGKCLGGATVATLPGRDRDRAGGPRRRALRPGADPRRVRACSSCSPSRSPRSA